MIALVVGQPAKSESKFALPHAWEALLYDALGTAGLRKQDVAVVRIDEGQPLPAATVYLAAGIEACRALVAGWDGSAEDRRGYVWEGIQSRKIVSTIHPASCLLMRDPSGINGMLLTADMEKARYENSIGSAVQRPHRTVTVVGDRDCRDAAAAIRKAGRVACDIECYDSQTIQCIGFATSATTAYVFSSRHLELALEIVADGGVAKTFQNGQFDAYFLETRLGTKLAGWQDDCMLAWHALWPEIAGKGAKGSKQTKKSLAFLASIYCKSPEWWKCLKADTPVLTASFAWKPIADVQIGEHVWGFDEFNAPGEKRRWRLAQVLGKNASSRPCIKIRTEHGSLVCTPDHKLLVKNKSGDWRWMQAQEARIGETLRFVSTPVQANNNYTTGWMGGFADGEGSVRWDRHSNSGGAITLAQNVGPILERAKHILQEDGFTFGEYEKQSSGTRCLGITGGRSAWLRFLAKYQPLRLCYNTSKHLEGAVFSTTPSRILEIEPYGEEAVVDIATSTGTFIAGGYAVHNCYDSADDAAMYQLNGLDCCITFEIMECLRKELVEQDVERIYRHEMSMMPVLIDIQKRGLLVAEAERQAAAAQLQERATAVRNRMQAAAEPLLRERRDRLEKPHLFFGTRRCSCCNGGKSKAMACWSCAGLEGPPRKRDGAVLQPCKVCGGAGKFETFEFNPASTAQLTELFYNVLGLPKRYNDGSLTVDEKALKASLADLG